MGIIGVNNLTTSSSVTTRDSLSELGSPLAVPSVGGLETGVVSGCLKTRTILGYVRQFTMPHDAGIGILCRQFLEQGKHGSLLGVSTSVVRTTFLIETTFITDAERALVVVDGMSTTDILRKNRDDGTIATDVVVVGGLAEAGLASCNQALDTERAVAAGRRTMYD